MCTAATYKTKDFYFGRTLDYEFSYGDQITITPRNYPFSFRHAGTKQTHYAIIGMAHVAGDYPLYYDAINEKGVGMAGLNFVGNAAYADVTSDRDNVAQFEFIHQLVELVGKHGCTMNEILDLFHTYSENIITEEMNNGEFDRLIRFADNSEDPYYYCFKDEGCHIIYHRFLPEDYADFDF